MPTDEGPDYRFVLANERTGLAYTRTALAFQIAGLGVLQFLTAAETWVRTGLGLVFVAVGSFLAAAGLVRWRSNEKAIRSEEEMTSARSLTPAALVVVFVPLAAAVALAVL